MTRTSLTLRPYFASIFFAVGLVCSGISYAQDIHFSVEAAKDTFLVYEQVNVRILVRNDGAEPFIRRPYTFGPDFGGKIMDVNANEEMGVMGLHLDRIGSPKQEIILQPGEERLWTDEILTWAATTMADPERPQHYLPPSSYAVICTWTYDPDPKGTDPTAEPLHLVDTVRFTVIQATGRNRDALDDFLSACQTCFEGDVQSCTEAHWRLAVDYPETPYATEAHARIVEYVVEYQIATLPDVDMDSVLMTFLLARPDDWRCRRYLPMTLKRLDEVTRRRFLIELRDSVPGTYAAWRATDELMARKAYE